MKYTGLHDKLLEEIKSGAIKPGAQLPHTMSLAKAYGVSHGTVARALALLVKTGHVHRVKSKGTFVSDSPKSQYFETRRTERVGWLFKGDYTTLLTVVYLTESFRAASEVLSRERKRLIPIPLQRRSAEEYLREIEASALCAVIVNDLHLPVLYASLKRLKIPFVCTDYLNFNLDAHQVTYDHLKAGALAFEALYSRGHKNLLFFGIHHAQPKLNDPDHETIWRAFEQAAGMERIKNVTGCFVAWEEPGRMKEQVRKGLVRHPGVTGIFCTGITLYNMVREIVEKETAFSGRNMDVVVSSTEKNLPTFCGRKPVICRWSAEEIGTTGARLTASILKGNVQTPRIHYLPVEIIQPEN